MHPLLVPAYGVAIAIEILLPLALALWLQRRYRVSWKVFGYGALVFLVFQVLTRVPAIQALQGRIQGRLESSPWNMVAWIAFAALTAGLFEEGGRYLGYRVLWKKGEERTWGQALMYGAGHGGLESMLLVGGMAVLSLISIINLMQGNTSGIPLTPDELAKISQARAEIAALPWWLPLIGALERILTMVIQVSLSVLVLQVFRRQRFWWWWLALGYHTLADLVVSLVAYGVSGRLPDSVAYLLVEASVLLFALLGVGIILWLRPKQEPTEALVKTEG